MKFEDADDDTKKLNYNYYDTDYGHGQEYMDYGYPQGYGKYLISLFYLVIFNSSCLNTTPQELRRIWNIFLWVPSNFFEAVETLQPQRK